MQNQTLDLNGINVAKSAARTLAQRSFYHFIRLFWDDVVKENPVWNWHIKYIADELQKVGERVRDRLPAEFDYLIVNVPPGSSKSTIASIFYPLWCWTIDPTQRFICASYADDIAEDHANKALRVLTGQRFRDLFPDIVMKRLALSHMENNSAGERYTAATGSAVTGKHAHQIIIDDPLNPKKAASEVELKTANDFVAQTLSTRKVDKAVTPTIVIMQRLHEKDVTGFLLDKRAEGLRVRQICLPGEASPRISPAHLADQYVDGLFDPVRLPREELHKMRTILGSYGYAGQFDQNPAPEAGGILQKAWFEVVDRITVPPGRTVHFRLDTAYTDKTKNDPTGILAYYMDAGFLYVLDYTTVRLEFPALVKFIPDYLRRTGYSQRSLVKVEPKATGLSVVQTLKTVPGLNILAGRPPKDDKVTRARAISAKVEAGKVKLHRAPWNDHFLHEVATFPNAAHDEAVDLLVEAVSEELVDGAIRYGYRRL